MLLNLTAIERGSPSLVGRGIANPMFERTRGLESHSPRNICDFPGKSFWLQRMLLFIIVDTGQLSAESSSGLEKR